MSDPKRNPESFGFYTFEEGVELIIKRTGWDRDRAIRELTEAIESGELPSFETDVQ